MRSLGIGGLMWQEGKIFITYCPELDVSSCGDTVEEARAHLRTAVRLFVEEAEKMGTLDTILRESGFKKTTKGWRAPRLMATEGERSSGLYQAGRSSTCCHSRAQGWKWIGMSVDSEREIQRDGGLTDQRLEVKGGFYTFGSSSGVFPQ